jgi:hypothetical protein
MKTGMHVRSARDLAESNCQPSLTSWRFDPAVAAPATASSAEAAKWDESHRVSVSVYAPYGLEEAAPVLAVSRSSSARFFQGE